MKLRELLTLYCFHDSSLNGIQYDRITHTVTMEIDLAECMQGDDKMDSSETKMIQLIFHNVSYIDEDNFVPSDYNEILDGRIISINGVDTGIEFPISNSFLNAFYLIRVDAESVEIIVNANP